MNIEWKTLAVVIFVVAVCHYFNFFRPVLIANDVFTIVHSQQYDDFELVVIKDKNNKEYIIAKNWFSISITAR